MRDVARLDMKAIDVVEPSVPGFRHDRQAPPVAGLVRRAMGQSPGNHGIASHADAVRVGDHDRTLEKTALLHLGRAGHLTVTIE